MRRACVSLAAATLALAIGCGNRHLQRPETTAGADAGAPEGDAAGPRGTADAGSVGSDDGGPPDIVPPVDPAVSRRWSWHLCGQLASAGPDTAAVFAPDGTMIVRGQDGTIRVYDDRGTRRLGPDLSADSVISAPDGTPLIVRAGRTIGLFPIGATTPQLELAVPAGAGCGQTYGFSGAGDYFLAHGGDGGPGASCIWRVADGGFVASFPDNATQAAIRGQSLVTLQARADEQVDLVTRDFAGNETGRLKLETRLEWFARLSPAGDRVAAPYPDPTLWGSDGRPLLVLQPNDVIGPLPVFTPSGDRVLMGDGVFQTADGARTATLPAANRLREARPLALSADGRRTIGSAYGRAALFEVSAPGFTAMLGPPLSGGAGAIPTLAISRDSVLAVATGGTVFGVRLAPRLEDSPTLWSIFAGDSAFIAEISDDGQWASAAGDNRALYSALDGRKAWPSPPPPADGRCYGTQLRISPKGTWAAGTSYAGTMDVFALADTTRAAWSPVSVLPTACREAAAFSRDEKTLATSNPSLYRLDSTTGQWQRVWSQGHATSPGTITQDSSDELLADVRFSPDETLLLASHCSVGVGPLTCTTTLYRAATGEVVQTLPALTAPRPSFSPEGSWIVAGSTLLHLPSGDTRPLPASFPAKGAVFTPDGDIVAGTEDGVLARFCRDR